MKPRIRKIVTFVEETLLEQGRPVDPPVSVGGLTRGRSDADP